MKREVHLGPFPIQTLYKGVFHNLKSTSDDAIGNQRHHI